MTPKIFKYLLSAIYIVLVYWLSWIGMRRTKDISRFSIGSKDMSPYVIGITGEGLLVASRAGLTLSLVNTL